MTEAEVRECIERNLYEEYPVVDNDLDHFGLDEAMQDYEFTAVAGLILHTLERMPTVGECVRWGEFTFEVVDMDGPRIDKVIVKKVPIHQRRSSSPHPSLRCSCYR